MQGAIEAQHQEMLLNFLKQEARNLTGTRVARLKAIKTEDEFRNWQESKAGRTAITDSLRGAVKAPPDFDERAALAEELQKKHGVQG